MLFYITQSCNEYAARMVFTGYEHAHQCTVAVGAVRSSSQTTAGDFLNAEKLGDIQSRFDSLDTLRATFTTSVIGFIMDSIMVVGVCVMMLLYGGYLTWIVLCFTTIYNFYSTGDIRQLPTDIRRMSCQGGPCRLLFYGNIIWYCHGKNPGDGRNSGGTLA